MHFKMKTRNSQISHLTSESTVCLRELHEVPIEIKVVFHKSDCSMSMIGYYMTLCARKQEVHNCVVAMYVRPYFP